MDLMHDDEGMPIGSPHPPMHLSFHQPRRPHTGQLYIATFATIVYAAAIPGLQSLGNTLAAIGWAVACVLCFLWVLLLRKENRFRRIENLEAPNASVGPSSARQSVDHSTGNQPSGISLAQPLMPHAHTDSATPFPFYISTPALVLVLIVCVGCLSFSGYLFGYAGKHRERLNGSSHWLSAISFFAAAKSAFQLWWRQRKVRVTFVSVSTYLRESLLPPMP